MVSTCLLAAVLAVASGTLSQEYQAAKERASGSADGLVRLALWCEQNGLDRECARNLALAVIKQPDNARARALLGMVKIEGRWRDAGKAAKEAAPEIFARYNAKRAEINSKSADDEWQLALWCERHELRAEARAHLAAVVQIDPKREAAWRHLGFKRHRGRWMTQTQIDAEIADGKAQAEADKHWGPKFSTFRGQLRAGGDAAEDARALLARVRDPRAVPKIWEIFVRKSARLEDHMQAVRMLARIDDPIAGQRLARLAVSDPHDAVREAAAEVLVKQDPRGDRNGARVLTDADHLPNRASNDGRRGRVTDRGTDV